MDGQIVRNTSPYKMKGSGYTHSRAVYIREIFSQYTQPLGWLCTAALHSQRLCTATGLAVHWAGCALGWHSGWLCTAAGLPVHCRCEYFCYGYTFIIFRNIHSHWAGCAQLPCTAAGCAQPPGWLCTGLAVHWAGTVAGCALLL